MFTYMLTIISADYPVRRSADLQSAVKKCPNLFGHCGFAIRNIQFVVLLGVFVGDYKSPGTPDGRLSIDAWRETFF